MFSFGKRKKAPQVVVDNDIVDFNDDDACRICKDLYLDDARRARYRRDYPVVRRPIMRATHGAGGVDYYWKACFEHYRVLHVVSMLVMAREMDNPIYPYRIDSPCACSPDTDTPSDDGGGCCGGPCNIC